MSQVDRSFWGWGDPEKFPGRGERRKLADRLETELGFPPLTIREPPSIEETTVPESRLSIPADLAAFVTDARADRLHHTYGKSYPDLVRGFTGAFAPAPDLVARPRDESEIERLLAWAGDNAVAVVPFGGGTSVVGGIEPDVEGRAGLDSDGNERPPIGNFSGVVSLSLRGLDEIAAVDTHSRRARMQAGLLGPEINEGLAEYDLQLRHYPQSYEFSTLGGWIATRAGGHFATVYTHIDDFVESVRAVTPAGTLETRDMPASGAGPDPNRFLLGSEGAFGVITDAWMRVQPRPEYRARASVRFDDFFDGVAATRRIVQARLYPANCRLLDPTEAMINEVAMDGSSILVLGFESVDHPVESDMERALEICAELGGRCPDGPSFEPPKHGGPGQEEDSGEDRSGAEGDWRQSFFDGPYLFNQLVSMGVLVDTFETAVTWDRFADLHAALQREVIGTMGEVCGMGVLSCRFTHVYPDGPAPYYTLLAPAEQGRELQQWRAVKSAASDVLMEHGATITHHHAVGRVHRDWYAQEVPDEYRSALRSMKRTLDPAGIMNPGALIE